MAKGIPTGFIASCCGAAGLFLAFGMVSRIPSGNTFPLFLSLGALVIAGRLYGVLTRLRRPNPSSLDIRAAISVIAADLVFLIAVQHGFIHVRIELDRGNTVGAILSFGLVTPILSLLARTLALSIGNRLLRI